MPRSSPPRRVRRNCTCAWPKWASSTRSSRRSAIPSRTTAAPLRHITGFAALPGRRSRAHRGRPGMAGHNYRGGEPMGRLIDDLPSFSRMGRNAMAKRCIRLDDVVRDARKEVAVNGSESHVSWTVHPLPEAAIRRDAASRVRQPDRHAISHIARSGRTRRWRSGPTVTSLGRPSCLCGTTASASP